MCKRWEAVGLRIESRMLLIRLSPDWKLELLLLRRPREARLDSSSRSELMVPYVLDLILRVVVDHVRSSWAPPEWPFMYDDKLVVRSS